MTARNGLTTFKRDDLYNSVADALERLLMDGIPLTRELLDALSERDDSGAAAVRRRAERLSADADAKALLANNLRLTAAQHVANKVEAARYVQMAEEAQTASDRLAAEADDLLDRMQDPEPPEVIRTTLDVAILAVAVLRHRGPWPDDVLAALHEVVQLAARDDDPLVAHWLAYVRLPTENGPQRFGPISGAVPNRRQRSHWNGEYELSVARRFFDDMQSLDEIGSAIGRSPKVVASYVREVLARVVPTDAAATCLMKAPRRIGRMLWLILTDEHGEDPFERHVRRVYCDPEFRWGHHWRTGDHLMRAAAIEWLKAAGPVASMRSLRQALGLSAHAYGRLAEGDDEPWVARFGRCLDGTRPGRGSDDDTAVRLLQCECGSDVTGLLNVPELAGGLLCLACGRGFATDLVYPSAYVVRARRPQVRHMRR